MTFLLICLFIVMIAISALCSGSETGLLSVPRSRVISSIGNIGSKKRESSAARRLISILNNLPNMMTTILIANNIANVSISTVSATLALQFFPLSPTSRTIWACITAVIILFTGEYLPKLLFSSKPLRMSLSVTWFLKTINFVLKPIAYIFSILINFVFRIKDTKGPNQNYSRESLRNLLSDKNDATRLTDFERRLIDRVLTLQATTAGDIAHPPTPDTDLRGLKIPSTTRGDDILPIMRKHRKTDAEVFSPETGEILGVVTEEDVLLLLTGVLK